jgi:hypothetical protein
MSDEHEINEKLLQFAAHNSLLFQLMREGHLKYPEGEVVTFILEQLENFLDELIPVLSKSLGKDKDYLDALYNLSADNINRLLVELENVTSETQVRIIMKSQNIH